MFSVRALVIAATAALVGSTAANEAAGAAKLPVFFFHGATGNTTNGAVIEANLTADGRTYTALDFCSNACSVRTALSKQVQMAIKQVREIVAKDTAAYANGYHFLAHSQGGSVARGVIEEMDDHSVHSFISLAGDCNGNFFGPQASDALPLQVLLKALGPFAIDATDFDFAKYAADSTSWKGKFQRDLVELVTTNEALQGKSSIANIINPPLDKAALANWLSIDPFLPKVNNLQDCGTDAINTCVADQKRRKENFVKLKAAHFFASPQDDVQAPWQSCLLGKYTTVATLDEVETKFADYTIVGMKDTVEYTDDLYGLKTLDTAGALHIHEVADVPHNCWLFDYTSPTDVACKHAPVYNNEIYPLLV
ncbi:Palmitoyl protein thioesterase [Phytophthora infestans]|uniref:Palmitoyl protein thioesterase n=1 Tax=Phytophthora infestans TaxID=4787 RepID=A0A833WDB9_PHYIN|nr:Palmitoyl protein thioesterase [Phytophthora infestans]